MHADDLTAALILIAVVFALLLAFLVRRRKLTEPSAWLARSCRAMLSNVLVPDGEGGEIHIEHALLCSRGIVLINLKEIDGNVFGSDTMHEWAVITGKSRFTFSNPQDGLYDRLAAVKRLTPDIPVHGFIAFSKTATFSKGVPAHVVMFDELLTDLGNEHNRGNPMLEAWLPEWESLKSSSVPA
jgi:hypothetical protein